MTMPTRIIREPERVGTGLQGGPALILSCDNGVDYTTAALGAVLGISPECVRMRLQKEGWQSRHIFLPPGAYKSEMMKKAHRRLKVVKAGPLYCSAVAFDRGVICIVNRTPCAHYIPCQDERLETGKVSARFCANCYTAPEEQRQGCRGIDTTQLYAF